MSRVHWTYRIIAVTAVMELLVIGIVGCDWVRDAAGLTLELEQRYPGSKVEIRDLHDGEAQRVEVKITAPAFDGNLNLASEAREVADLIQRQYELGSDDTIGVEFQSERRLGPFGSSRSASFDYPVSELSAR